MIFHVIYINKQSMCFRSLAYLKGWLKEYVPSISGEIIHAIPIKLVSSNQLINFFAFTF